MGHSDTVHELNHLAIKTRLMSELDMITIYLLDDLNYIREDAARAIIDIINDLDTVAACISFDKVATAGALNEVAAEKECS